MSHLQVIVEDLNSCKYLLEDSPWVCLVGRPILHLHQMIKQVAFFTVFKEQKAVAMGVLVHLVLLIGKDGNLIIYVSS